MKYIKLSQKINSNIFSLQDLKIQGCHVSSLQLTRWVDKGYLIKLKNGVYLFADRKEQTLKEYIAFSIYQSSYISLEWALSLYGMIPEVVYSVTSVTSRTSRKYENAMGVFTYRHLKNNLFFGYTKINKNGQVYLLAEREKALLDYIYLNSHKIKNIDDVEELRLNSNALKKISKTKIKKYSKFYPKKNNIEKILKLIIK
jgi:predicted transcriptional regulator of viral defense system